VLREIIALSCFSLFASVQSKGQQAIDAINNYQSVVSLLNTSTLMALEANRTIQDAMILSSVDELQAAVNQSVAASKALQQTTDQLKNSFAASGRWQEPCWFSRCRLSVCL